jgi:RNA polymerase sigma factor (TIGR02999 family)
MWVERVPLMTDVTRILNQIRQGDSTATAELLTLVYQELRQLARAQMARERSDHTLQATALVNEACLRLLGNADANWDGRGHFFAAAAEAMRRILVEHARSRNALKRDGQRQRVELGDNSTAVDSASDAADLLTLNDALDKLAAEAPHKAQLVKLRYFAGLSLEEAAQTMNISPATAKRYWAYSRAFLYDAMPPED